MVRRALRSSAVLALVVSAGCVPPGNSTPSDAGSATSAVTTPQPSTIAARPTNVLTAVFEDDFNRPGAAAVDARAPMMTPSQSSGEGGAAKGDAGAAGPDTGAPKIDLPPGMPPSSDLGPNWYQSGTSVWHIENGRLCGQNARNHGVWMTKAIPVNARIEFDAISSSPDGDLKAEVWGDGQSSATSISYTNATSYLAILGGWHNKYHVLARINEHGEDRKEIHVDKTSDDPREHPVVEGQIYHFKIERTDGKTVKWSVNGLDMTSYPDPAPLTGPGHDHFGFNDWEVKVCFDNVKVTPISSL